MLPSINNSLQKKFILIAFLSVFLLAIVVSIFVATKTRSVLYNATEQKGRMLAQTVSALIINELIYEKLGLVEEGGLIDNYVRELYLRQELELRYVAVLDNHLQVISHSNFSEFGKYYQDPFVKNAQQAHDVLVKTDTFSASQIDTLLICRPAFDRRQALGSTPFCPLFGKCTERSQDNTVPDSLSCRHGSRIALCPYIFPQSQIHSTNY